MVSLPFVPVLPIKERDWVVVGATDRNMLDLGYRQVGKEFPVFLHPKTHEEYALARMERKVKPGYKGFTFDASQDVSLEADLQRRDLTINAMAETPHGELIDPFHGKQDLQNKILRHVSPAFKEDPVRILRVGRFLARYAHLGFHVAPETITLMRAMVKAGEVDALVAERVWKEFERALLEKNPEKFFEVLAACGALPILFPSLNINGWGIKALIAAVGTTNLSAVRLATLLHDMPDAKRSITTLCNRYRAPHEYRELATLTALHYAEALKVQLATPKTPLSANEILKLLSALDIFRREERFKNFLTASHAIARARQIDFDPQWLIACANVAKSYDVHGLIAKGLSGNELAAELKEQRLKEIEKWLRNE